MTVEPHIKRALRIIIIGQCVGLVATLLFGNGFMLAYFSKLGVPDYRILLLFALIPLISMTLILPFAYLADRTGKKRLGGLGIAVSAVGFFMLIGAPIAPGETSLWLTLGVLIFATGNAANASSWFALLSPIVPENIRGRWFGQMRTAWQTTAIVFSLGVAALLQTYSSLPVFQSILFVCGVLILVRFVLYLQIPELEPIQPPRGGFWKALHEILHLPGYLPFCAYIFLLSFLTGAIPGLLGLLEKEFLGFSDSLLVVMGNLLSIGAVVGFLIGGKMVDRLGPRPVFLTGHAVFSITLAGVLLRGFIPLPSAVTLGLLSLLFGAMQGAAGIASTSELFALIPQKNKSLSTGFNLTLIAAGLSFSGLFSGQILKWNILRPEWVLWGNTLSSYDALLAGFMILTILMAVTPLLVPVIRHLHRQWIPQNK